MLRHGNVFPAMSVTMGSLNIHGDSIVDLRAVLAADARQTGHGIAAPASGKLPISGGAKLDMNDHHWPAASPYAPVSGNVPVNTQYAVPQPASIKFEPLQTPPPRTDTSVPGDVARTYLGVRDDNIKPCKPPPTHPGHQASTSLSKIEAPAFGNPRMAVASTPVHRGQDTRRAMPLSDRIALLSPKDRVTFERVMAFEERNRPFGWDGADDAADMMTNVLDALAGVVRRPGGEHRARSRSNARPPAHEAEHTYASGASRIAPGSIAAANNARPGSSTPQASPAPSAARPVVDTRLQELMATATPEVLEAEVEKGLQLLHRLAACLSQQMQSSQDAQQWMTQINSLLQQDIKQPTVIGVVGNTGAGKSSVINAMLDEERLVPTNW